MSAEANGASVRSPGASPSTTASLIPIPEVELSAWEG